MGAWNVDSGGLVKPTRSIAPTKTTLTVADMKDPLVLSMALNDLNGNVADLMDKVTGDTMHKRALFEDVAVLAGATVVRLEHRMGRRVEWQVTRWTRTTPGGTHGLEESLTSGVADSDKNTLVLVSYVAGTATIRVW